MTNNVEAGRNAKIIIVKTKKCPGCAQWLPISKFYASERHKRTGRSPRCKHCVSIVNRKYYAKHCHSWNEKYYKYQRKTADIIPEAIDPKPEIPTPVTDII